MIGHTPSAIAHDLQDSTLRMASLVFWFVTRYNDIDPGPCPEPNTDEDELARELIAAGYLEVGALEGELIPTKAGWNILSPIFERMTGIGK